MFTFLAMAGGFLCIFLILVEATKGRATFRQHLGDVIHDIGVNVVNIGWKISGR